MAQDTEFSDRLRKAMARAAIPATGGELWKVIHAHAKRLKMPCPIKGRQTPYNWLLGMMPNGPDMIFLSEALGANAKWLATGRGRPNRGIQPDELQQEVLGILEHLDPAGRAIWVRQGHDLLRLTGKASRVEPYVK